ncbi:MAG: glycosyltransferase family 4 protein [Acidobacteria bacterium]|nr:glycosyltransferase family 4 protein [Acidobacteriota bacterium]
MKVTFVLPMYLNSPSGGFKVVYEYANRLSALGHQITIVHPRSIQPQRGFIQAIKKRLWQYKQRLVNRPLISWYAVDAGVNLLLVKDLSEGNIPDADVIFATACETAFPVAVYSAGKGKKFYLVQSYETWNQSEELVLASWKLPMHKVVISSNLFEVAATIGEQQRTSHIPNGIDFSNFKLITPVNQRGMRIGMLAHPNQAKGTKDGLQALEIVKQRHPELQAVLFGTESRLDFIPGWISYERQPSQVSLVDLYNSCAIFLNPSWTEGWGLTSAEAMACGCALVTADNGGANEFCVDGESGLIVPIKNPKLLAEEVLNLFGNDELRMRIALSGHKTIQQFTWERAVKSFIEVISA